ncbi:hypothetical protein ACVBEG_26760 [Pseudomonas sp. GG8]
MTSTTCQNLGQSLKEACRSAADRCDAGGLRYLDTHRRTINAFTDKVHKNLRASRLKIMGKELVVMKSSQA